MKLKKIISGGQTGADQAGLRAAKRLNLFTGGFAPKGFRTENGPAPWLGYTYQLEETDSFDYSNRTLANIALADATVIFARKKSSGSRLTEELAETIGKPLIVNPGDHQEFRMFLAEHDVKVLNVAGNRESGSPGIGRYVETFIVRALEII